MTDKFREQLGEDIEWTDYTINKSKSCHLSSWNYFVEQGEIPISAAGTKEYCLHHIDPALKYFDIVKYAEWNISDVIPMTTADHAKLHRDFEKRNSEYGFLDQIFLDHVN